MTEKSRSPKKLRTQHHALMLEAAKAAFALGRKNGVDIHIFGASFASKIPRKNTHGSKDALNWQSSVALSPWTDGYPANPCIRLDRSGLVAIDVDHGFENLTDEQMIATGEANGLPRTNTIRTGRENGGATFFYRGTRMLPDCTGNNGFKVGELSGDIKCHGHVAAAGSLHKTGNFYRCINDAPFAPLPDFWRDYTNPKKPKASKPTPFEQDWLRRTETDPILKNIHDYMQRHRQRVLDGTEIVVKDGVLIPRGRRFKYLTRQAGIMRAQGLDPEIIRHALDLRAVKKCENGRDFIVSHKTALDDIAGWSTDWPEGDYFMRSLSRPKRPARHDLLVAAFKQFPDRITSGEGYDRLEDALEDTGFRLNRDTGAGQNAARKAREAAGFIVERPGGICTWIRGVVQELVQDEATDHSGSGSGSGLAVDEDNNQISVSANQGVGDGVPNGWCTPERP